MFKYIYIGTEENKLNKLLFKFYNKNIEKINQFGNEIKIISEIRAFYRGVMESNSLNLDYSDIINTCKLHKINIFPELPH